MSAEGDRLRALAAEITDQFTVRTPDLTTTRIHIQPGDAQLFIDAANCLEAPPPETGNGGEPAARKHHK